jgi:hypothetical protein
MDPAQGDHDFASPTNLLEIMDGIAFPSSKVDLVDYAQNNGASEEILDQIRAMPDIIYNSIRDINRHANEIEAQPGDENLWSSEPSDDLPDATDRRITELNGNGRV